MMVRPFNPDTDYKAVCEWWAGHSWPAIPLEKLPRIGFVCEELGNQYCAGFLYFAESGWAWLEWIVTNPKSPVLGRKTALEKLVTHALDLASRAGVNQIVSSLQNENLIALYERAGFRKMDSGMTTMLWRRDQWQSQPA